MSDSKSISPKSIKVHSGDDGDIISLVLSLRYYFIYIYDKLIIESNSEMFGENSFLSKVEFEDEFD